MYEETCSNCDALYIGKTSWTFHQSFSEHTREITSKKHVINSKYAETSLITTKIMKI